MKVKKRNWFARQLESEQFTTKQIIGMLIPLILDQLFIYMIGLLTTSMISSSGEDSVTAVSLVTPVVTLITAVFTALSSWGAIVVAQYKGHGDREKLQEAIGQTIWICVILAVVLNGLIAAFASPLVNLLFGAAEEGVREKATLYLAGMAINTIVHSLRVATSAGLRGVGDIKHNLFGSILINVSYFIFCYIFINLLQWDIVGTLVAYFLARFLGLLSSLYFLFFQKNSQVHIRLSQMLKPKLTYLKSIWKLGIPFCAEEVFFNGGAILVSAYMVFLGTVSVAAHTIANSIFSTLYAPTMAVGILATTVIGQCIGAGRRDLAQWYGKKLILLGYGVALISLIAMLPMLSWIISLYQPQAETQSLVYQLLAIGIAGMILFWPVSNIMPSVLRAAGDAYFTTVASLIAMWVFRVGMGYVISIPMGYGIRGIWYCMIAEWVVRCIFYVLRYHSGRWLQKKTVVES